MVLRPESRAHPLAAVLAELDPADCPRRLNFHCHTLCSDGSLAPERLASVRVTRGGGSGAFGAGAVAGTIELTSADAASPWKALWAMLVGFFMILLDTTIVAVANPGIMAALGIDDARVPLTFPTRGNIGPASVPFTLAVQAPDLVTGQRVGCLGIGSGLNAMVIEIAW